MEELAKLEAERGKPGYAGTGGENRETGLTAGAGRKGRIASNEMCTFLILNISSLQLIPVNMIAYRQQYGSVNPAGIIAPAIHEDAEENYFQKIICQEHWKKLLTETNVHHSPDGRGVSNKVMNFPYSVHDLFPA